VIVVYPVPDATTPVIPNPIFEFFIKEFIVSLVIDFLLSSVTTFPITDASA
jgi:hypothetical protein